MSGEDAVLLWRNIARGFGVTDLRWWDRTKDRELRRRTFDDRVHVSIHDSLEDSLDVEGRRVFTVPPDNATAPDGITPLSSFQHPTDPCWYVFGSDSGGVDFAQVTFREDDLFVTVPTRIGSIYSFCAASVVLYDRSERVSTHVPSG